VSTEGHDILLMLEICQISSHIMSNYWQKNPFKYAQSFPKTHPDLLRNILFLIPRILDLPGIHIAAKYIKRVKNESYLMIIKNKL